MSSLRLPDHHAADIALADVLRPGDTVMLAQGVSEPLGLVAALRAQVDSLSGVSLFSGFSPTGLLDVELARSIRLVSNGAMGTFAAVADAGLLDVIPCNYSDFPALIADRHLPADVVMLQVTPPDEHGMCSTGISMDYTVEALEVARAIIAEVNDQLPRHPDAYRIPFDRLTLTTNVSRPLLEIPSGQPSGIDESIAAGVADQIPDGATIQLGFGATVNAIGALLTRRRNLRVHSALVGDWLLDLDRAGALAKPDGSEPVIVIGAAMGSAELYDFLVTDPRVRMRRIGDVQRPEVLAVQDKLFAVNSALQVSLAGHVNVEFVGPRRISQLGGHCDFSRGAQASRGGRSIVALPSIGGRDQTSRIVVQTDSGWVSTPQNFVDIVITEYGVADLRGATIEARRRALADIAHPSHRVSLLAESEPARLVSARTASTPREGSLRHGR